MTNLSALSNMAHCHFQVSILYRLGLQAAQNRSLQHGWSRVRCSDR